MCVCVCVCVCVCDINGAQIMLFSLHQRSIYSILNRPWCCLSVVSISVLQRFLLLDYPYKCTFEHMLMKLTTNQKKQKKKKKKKEVNKKDSEKRIYAFLLCNEFNQDVVN